MTSRLLAATKFSVPPLPGGYVPRPRLHAALDSALPLTIVVGVPGAGKSVLLRSWVHERPELQTIWLSCDARDGDLATFWRALCTALANTWPDRWVEAIDALSDSDPDFDDIAIAVINDLADLGEPVVLIIDDFQFGARAAPSLLTLIEHLPTGCRVVVGSRTEPQLRLHRSRVYGQLLEVRDAQLRLTPAEVAAVMREHKVELTETELELVAEHTDLWMAGVQMVAVALRDGSDPDRFLADLAKTRGAIVDFLGTEVLDRQDAETRDFLLATSILDVLTPTNCVAVSERHDAGELLRHLAEENLFLIDLGGGAYRYHHLFADLLQGRLREIDRDRELSLHRRAASYFLEVGDVENAIDHLLAADEDAEVFSVLRNNLVASFHQGDGHIPRRLVANVEAHSSEIAPARIPDLAIALAASGLPGEAQPWINRAQLCAADLSDIDVARLALAKALVALQYGNAADIESAFSDYRRPEDFPDEELAEFVPGLLARARLWLGDVKGARELCERVLGPYSGVSLASELAWVAYVEGHLAESAQIAARALANADSMGLVDHPVMVEAICAQGGVAFERGEFAAAETLLERALSISEDVRPAQALVSQLLLSKVWLIDGRVGDALDGATRAREFLPSNSTSPLLALCEELEARVALATSDFERAERHAQNLTSGHQAFVLQTEIDIARGKIDRASETLARCVPATIRERLDVAVLTARIAHGRKVQEVDVKLAKAIDLARTEGFVVPVTDDLVDLRSNVVRHLRSGHIGRYEEAVLDRLEQGVPLAKGDGGEPGLLSDRERTVVRYLASRLTMREIAAEIFVSTNTLKTHVKRAYSKLGASSRTEAVAEARRLGLL